MKLLMLTVVSLQAALMLSGCGPSEKQKAQWAEHQRIECLNKFCAGDVEPKVDKLKLQTFKINGQWFTVPKEYGGYDGSLGFFWPSKTPANSERAAKDAPEFTPSAAGQLSNFYEVGIEFSFVPTTSQPSRTATV